MVAEEVKKLGTQTATSAREATGSIRRNVSEVRDSLGNILSSE